MNLEILQGPYLTEVLDQPRAMEATERGLETPPELRSLAAQLAAGQLDQVVLTGMGSSYHALHPLHLNLIARGMVSMMVETSELIHHQSAVLKPKTLLVVVSQSGASVETVRLLERLPTGVEVIGITNTPGSPLAQRATAVLFTRAGTESTVSCKTYVTALMALEWLAGVLSDDREDLVRWSLRLAVSATAAYLGDWLARTQALAKMLDGVQSLFLVGRGASLAAAGVGGLIIKESAHVHAEGMSGAAFRHGPFEMLSGQTFVGVFLGDAKTAALNRRLCSDVVRAGGRAAVIGAGRLDGPFGWLPAPDSVRPILEMLPVELMSFALAALRGREAGRFERGSKITTVE